MTRLEFKDLYILRNIIRLIASGNIKWSERAARVEELKKPLRDETTSKTEGKH